MPDSWAGRVQGVATVSPPPNTSGLRSACIAVDKGSGRFSAQLMPAHTLLIDVGNGRTKFALCTASDLLERRDSSTRKLSAESLRDALADWSYDKVVACSVVPRATETLREHFGSRLRELRHDSDLGIGIHYPKPASIGPDRLANALALSALHTRDGQPGIVIDFGTAVTFDVLSADHAYIGGVIAPGMRLMTDYLHERTALLPLVQLREPDSAIGQSTEGAILSGAAHGYRGMVRGVLAALKAELINGEHAAVIGTGGDAEWICTAMPEVHRVDADLTLHGLRLFAQR
jgi:type III pantothenate kinase